MEIETALATRMFTVTSTCSAMLFSPAGHRNGFRTVKRQLLSSDKSHRSSAPDG